MNRIFAACVLSFLIPTNLFSQTINFENKEFELSNVKASVIDFEGAKVLKVERDLQKLAFDEKRLGETVDEPTFVKLKNFDFKDGTIEVKLFSQIQNPSPFDAARGFIGIDFRINDDNSAFESIYLRPKNGKADNQFQRNHTIQYFSYPDFKFDKLRKENNGIYETWSPISLNEWITMRIEIKGERAELFINNEKYSTLIVEKMKGKTKSGSVALRVDIGTIGYFKDLKITQ